MKREVPEWKKKEVERLSKGINKYPTIGICRLEGIPTRQLQTIRAKLREHAYIVVSKKSLLRRALKKADKKCNELREYVRGITALLLTDLDPFELYSILKKNKSPAPARAGQESPKDIVVTSGPTSFTPGPIMSQFGDVGIKPKIEKGKLVIPEDTVVVEEGEEVSPEAANILNRLDIKPMTVGLDVEVVLNKKEVYPREVLDVSEEEFVEKLRKVFSGALNLGVNAGIPTSETAPYLLRKVDSDARSLVLSESIIWGGETEKLLNMVNSQANALKDHVRGE